jgi:hypothetical protein
MNSPAPDIDISAVEVTNISPHGFWLLVDGTEYFLAFSDFPWFREATIAAIVQVERWHDEHLRWPLLDVDLELEAIRQPLEYPLVAKGDIS